MPDKGLYIKYIKNSYNSRKPNNPVKKWAEDLNRLSSKKAYRWPAVI